ncbi:MAG: hypothetical protein ACLUVC_03720 [Longibaculum sp.]
MLSIDLQIPDITVPNNTPQIPKRLTNNNEIAKFEKASIMYLLLVSLAQFAIFAPAKHAPRVQSNIIFSENKIATP